MYQPPPQLIAKMKLPLSRVFRIAFIIFAGILLLFANLNYNRIIKITFAASGKKVINISSRNFSSLDFAGDELDLEFVIYGNELSTKSKSNTRRKEEMVTTLLQNDSRILNYIRKNHLFPPSTKEYNLRKPGVGETDLDTGLTTVIKELLGDKKNGFFIEAGSNDGEHISSTLGFEKFRSWRGLCVEASPALQSRWRSKNRKAWLANVCLSPKSWPVWTNFLHRDDYSVGSKLGDPEDIVDEVGNWTHYNVPCFPIFSILSALNVKEVDYFNLDVEGVEEEVLRTIPFNEILIRTISVEFHRNADDSARKTVQDFMTGKGYQTVYIKNADYIFAHNSIAPQK